MLPEVRLDTERFGPMVEECRTMIAGIFPEWTDFNYHDPGITFLELFVWLKENQQFFLEQLGASHYEQFFRLLGFERYKRRPARLLASPRDSLACRIGRGSVFEAGELVFETDEEENLIGEGLRAVCHEAPSGGAGELADAGQLAFVGGMAFYPFGRSGGKGEACRLLFSSPLEPETTYHLFVQVKEEQERLRNPLGDGDFSPLVSLSWSYDSAGGFAPVTILSDETKGFLFSGRIAFRIGGPMAARRQGDGSEAYVLRAVVEEGAYDLAPCLSGISMNHILLVQKRTWRDDAPFLLAEGDGFPNQEYVLPWKEPIAGSVRLEAEDVLCPGRFEAWRRVEDFLGCGPSDRCFVVDEDQGTVRFGDGRHGMPPEGRIRLLSMEETRGGDGGVKAGTELFWQGRGGIRFLAGRELTRGRSRETVQEALFRLGSGDGGGERAVTAEDYERIVKATPGLIVYSCKVLDEGQQDNQAVIVVRPGDGRRNLPLSSGYGENILKNLDSRRLIGTRIRLCAPEYIEVRVYLEVSAMPQYREAGEMVKETVRAWFERLGASFGEPVSYGALYGLIDSMPCVRRLKVLNLEARNAGVGRNQGGDLIPPANGVFLLRQIEYIQV